MNHLVIFYHKHQSFTIEGRVMQFGPIEDTYAVALEVTGTSVVAGQQVQPGSVMLVDPTAVVVNVQTASVVYNGRDWYAEMPADLKKYFDEHPEWPAVLRLNGLRQPLRARLQGGSQETN